MKRRTWIAAIAVPIVGLMAGAGAMAFGAHGGRHGMMKRFVAAALDDALDEARVTPEQRTAIHGARDRAFAAVETAAPARHARVDEALLLFESDTMDAASVAALRADAEARHRAVGDAVGRRGETRTGPCRCERHPRSPWSSCRRTGFPGTAGRSAASAAGPPPTWWPAQRSSSSG